MNIKYFSPPRPSTLLNTFRSANIDIAVPEKTGYVARGIEQCRCPQGYGGVSCQDCEPGNYRDRDDRLAYSIPVT